MEAIARGRRRPARAETQRQSPPRRCPTGADGETQTERGRGERAGRSNAQGHRSRKPEVFPAAPAGGASSRDTGSGNRPASAATETSGADGHEESQPKDRRESRDARREADGGNGKHEQDRV